MLLAEADLPFGHFTTLDLHVAIPPTLEARLFVPLDILAESIPCLLPASPYRSLCNPE